MASEKFIERINAREIEAFKEIYDRYYRTLVVYAANFIEDGDVGEDLVQELIINIWENRMTFTSLSTFNAYLYNAVLRRLKRLVPEDRRRGMRISITSLGDAQSALGVIRLAYEKFF